MPVLKLQVFVSSTYKDLEKKRQAAVMAILEAEHIPAGMELFAAGDENQWKVIQRWIDESDVYLLILGGRYGTIEPTSGKSYIECEYDYAIKQNKPFFALVIHDDIFNDFKHNDPKFEQDHMEKLKSFRERVKKTTVSHWKNEDQIKTEILKSLQNIAKRNTSTGWVRFDGNQPYEPFVSSLIDNNSKQIIKFAQEHNITSIRRRLTSQEKLDWHEHIKASVDKADEFLFVIARSLDSLLPVKNTKNGIISSIEDAIERNIKLIFILANTFDRDAGFRLECNQRAVEEDSSVLYHPNRATVIQLIKLANRFDAYNQLLVKLIKNSPPFAMFMTEKDMIVEPYLPYIEGGEAMIFSVEASNFESSDNNIKHNDIYCAFFRSYLRILDESEHVADVLKLWKSKPEHQDPENQTRYYNTLIFAQKMQDQHNNTMELLKPIFSRFDPMPRNNSTPNRR